LAAARAWQERERRDAFERIADLAETVEDWDIEANRQARR
jgi:hypothetical protein